MVDIGVKVAALMTEAIIARRLPRPVTADRVVLPGRCRADLERLAAEFGVPFVRGPDEIADLPGYSRPRRPRRSTCRATTCASSPRSSRRPRSSVDAILGARRSAARGRRRRDRPRLPAGHAVSRISRTRSRALKDDGLSRQRRFGRRRRAAARRRAGADYLLSLTEETLDIADERRMPVLILVPTSMAISIRCCAPCEARRDARHQAYLADPVLDPIHFGFTASLDALRRAAPALARRPRS